MAKPPKEKKGLGKRLKSMFGYVGKHEVQSSPQSASGTSLQREDNQNTTGVTPPRATEPQSQICSPIHSSHNLEEPSTNKADKPCQDVAASRQDLSKQLWNRAYDTLHEDKADLVDRYVKILANVLAEAIIEERNKENNGNVSDSSEAWKVLVVKVLDELKDTKVKEHMNDALETGTSDEGSAELEELRTDILTKLTDPTKRQIFLDMLVENGKSKAAETQKWLERSGKVADAVLSIKPIMNVILQILQAAHAALPWAGICLGLEMLSAPAKMAQSQREGIAYVTSKMNWYCVITDDLLYQEDKPNGNTSKANSEDSREKTEDDKTHTEKSARQIMDFLEGSLCKLYKAVLYYQIQSVCYYYGSARRQALSSVDWNKAKEAVTKAENDFLSDWNVYKQVEATELWHQLLESAEKNNEILQQMKYTLTEFMELQKSMKLEDNVTKCLQALYVVNPVDGMGTIEHDREELHENVCSWVLRHREYNAFTSRGSSCRLLWIKGPPGMGKTFLMISIVRQLLDQSALRVPSLSCFFCKSGEIKSNNATAILRTLLWMLLYQQPNLMHHVLEDYRHSGESLFTDGNALTALKRIFGSIAKTAYPVYFIIDALDECEKHSTLIKLISTSLENPNVRWLISSRPEIGLTAEIAKVRKRVSELPLPELRELDVESQGEAVATYVQHRLSQLDRDLGYTEERLPEIAKAIRKRAKKNLLWVSIAFDGIKKKEFDYAIKHIADLPQGLTELYEHKVESLTQLETKLQQRCFDVLMTMSLIYRLPLLDIELRTLLPWSERESPLEAVRECSAFLVITNRTINMRHKSAKDYMDKERHELQGGIVKGHTEIFRRSIDVLISSAQKSFRLDRWNSGSGIISPLEKGQLESVQYICTFWLDHLRDAITGATVEAAADLCNAAFDFLKEHFLHWLESLGVLHQLPAGIISIQRLLGVFKSWSNIDAEFIGFLKDAERFAVSYRSIIDQAPEQIYSSLMIFAPKQSEVRRIFKDKAKWIKLKPRVEEKWSQCIQTLEGHSHWVTSVAFSHDSALVASASHDNTVRIWRANRGECMQTLEGHSDWVTSVAFSHDSALVASASHDNTVRVWRADTGECIQTLEGHSHWVTSVAFSHDSALVASASDDNTVQIWRADTGECIQTLKGRSGWVTLVAFSHDSALVALASSDNTVRIWRADTGKCIQTLKGHSGGVRSVAFSHDSALVALASSDNTVQIWRADTGKCMQTLEGHSDWVTAVAFSHDSALVASASRDKTVQIWRANTGECMQTLEGHSDWVTAVAFSHDSALVASASIDNTVRIWRADRGECMQTLEGHSDSVSLVAFSNDSALVASASDDNTVRIWRADTGECMQTLEGHSDWVTSVAFSHDSALVASASIDKTVRIWRANRGKCIQTLKGHSSSVRSVAFSHDSALVASASDDNTVRIWRADTGECMQALKGHSGSVTSVAFSHDSALVASASNDNTVRIWRADRGECMQTLKCQGSIPQCLVFDLKTSCLLTNIGAFALQCLDLKYTSRNKELSTKPCGLGISTCGCWITWKGDNLLWLPVDFRPSCWAASSSTIAIGSRKGKVFIIRL